MQILPAPLRRRLVALALALLVPALHAGEQDAWMVAWYKALPEPVATPSPTRSARLALLPGEAVKAMAVSPLQPLALVAFMSEAQNGLMSWDLQSGSATDVVELPSDLEITSLAFHPDKPAVYLTARQGDVNQLLRLALPLTSRSPVELLRSDRPLADLVMSTRPFTAPTSVESPAADPRTTSLEYRLYFSEADPGGHYRLRSIREGGSGDYVLMAAAGPAAVAPRAAVRSAPSVAVPATASTSASAAVAAMATMPSAAAPSDGAAFTLAQSGRPVAVHPYGNELAWRADNGCMGHLHYKDDNWSDQPEPARATRMPESLACGSSGHYLPNGLGWLTWQAGVDGAELHGALFATTSVARGVRFEAEPLLTQDGAGLVGVVRGRDGLELRYELLNAPMAEVANAGAVVDSPAALNLLLANDGFFRPGVGPQLYSLYDTAQYDSRSRLPTTPYLVTTDLFWELYAAVFESLLTVTEDNSAVPAFWSLVKEAHRHFQIPAMAGRAAELPALFDTLEALRTGRKDHPEVALLLAGAPANSTVTHKPFDFGQTVPRGYYTRSEQARLYFRAMTYLSRLQLEPASRLAFVNLPEVVQMAARDWLRSYQPFIAGGRGPSVWVAGPAVSPLTHHPVEATVFPLSWGWDNEVLDRVVMHSNWPAAEQVERALPSGLDLAASTGNALSWRLLAAPLRQVPNYRTQLSALRDEFLQRRTAPEFNDSLYHAWLQALAVQWADAKVFPGSSKAASLWDAKRLQTGLASWATLRHANVLVADSTGAEAGEGGEFFEFLVQRPPRGYVEPDPATFDAIAGLFDQTLTAFDGIAAGWASPAARDLRKGLHERLVDSRDTIRGFADMARAELDGQPLSDEQYVQIYFTARAIEYNFLGFKSALAARATGNEPYGLVTPNPLPKIADVATSPAGRRLVAVGQPLEWQQVVPFFGRRQIVKGATYSYHELTSAQVLTDEAWNARVANEPLPLWVYRYFLADPKAQWRVMNTTRP